MLKTILKAMRSIDMCEREGCTRPGDIWTPSAGTFCAQHFLEDIWCGSMDKAQIASMLQNGLFENSCCDLSPRPWKNFRLWWTEYVWGYRAFRRMFYNLYTLRNWVRGN